VDEERVVGLTDDELEVARVAGEAATKFAALPPMHPSDLADFVHHVHALQSLVMARAAQRAHPDVFPTYAPKHDHVVVMQPETDAAE
jgi:hypothetical protein